MVVPSAGVLAYFCVWGSLEGLLPLLVLVGSRACLLFVAMAGI